MAEFKVTSEQLQDLAKRLAADLKPAMKAATLTIAIAVQDEIAGYPPPSEANSEGRYPSWYRRGSGTVRITRTGQETELRNSEQLGRKWAIQDRGETKTALVNTASYAPFVHGGEYQAWFHAERGWKTDEDARAAVIDSGMATAVIDAEINKVLKT